MFWNILIQNEVTKIQWRQKIVKLWKTCTLPQIVERVVLCFLPGPDLQPTGATVAEYPLESAIRGVPAVGIYIRNEGRDAVQSKVTNILHTKVTIII